MENAICYEQIPPLTTLEEGLSKVSGPLGLPKSERPRERLMALGPASLTDRELLSVLLNSGIKGKDVLVLAGELVERLDSERRIPPVQELANMIGLGYSKACAVVAMLEYGRRRWGPCGSRINHPSDAYALIRHFADRRQERFICISLNGAHETLAVRIVTIGLVNRTIVHPREVFSDPLIDRSSAIIVAHNHPSGRLQPSEEDEEITRRLKATADLLGISLLDHLIFSETEYFSFSQEGRLN